ncbi:hypothetical protein EPUL_003831 [Erysiphe pulchra]|uniref:Integrase catalytic domain-containing protein n=1 Tax=Erysiphe pulchra TaxID=225359 RepID=A0A2S4PTT1_9PEZI|nr:hypothetical protein EPUL_003831 [Erysiphe pulchra]
MENMKVHYNNLTNLLTQRSITDKENTYPVIRKYGHPFLLLGGPEESLVHSYEKLDGIIESKILSRSSHDFNRQAIKHLTKFCDSCQKYSKSPGRFKFNLKDDKDFNSFVYIDVHYIDEKPVLQVVAEATCFQAAHWLKSMNAQEAWNSLRNCWIDVYLGPPDVVVHDAGTNFTGKEFKQSAIAMSITTKAAPTEAHHSIGLVERYHTPLRRAYEVISKDLGGTKIDRTSLLQMAVKAVNDTAGPDSLVPTLLVFGAYPRMIESDPPTPSIFERAAAIKSAMKEVRKICAKEKVRNALKMRNGPITSELKDVLPNEKVLVWRENKEWTGPYKLIRIEGEDCVVQVGDHMPTFRSTSVKPYYSDKNAPNSNDPQLDEEFIGNNFLSNKNSEIIEPRRSNRIRKPRNFGNFFVSNCNLVTISTYISQQLNETQQRYSAQERESLVILMALRHWHHESLRSIQTKLEQLARIIRFLDSIEHFSIRIIYRKGKSNVPTDFLYRASDEAFPSEENRSIDENLEGEYADIYSQNNIEEVRNDGSDRAEMPELPVLHRVLLRKPTNIGNPPVSSEAATFLEILVYENLTLEIKNSSLRDLRPIQPAPPLTRWGVGHTQVVSSILLIAMEYATGWLESRIVSNANFSTSVPLFLYIFNTFGTPKKIISDNANYTTAAASRLLSIALTFYYLAHSRWKKK